MNPHGLMNCMSDRRAPLDKKREQINDLINEVERIEAKFRQIDQFNVSDEIKEAISDSLQGELAEVKNDIYDIVESITIPKFTKEDKPCTT